MKAIAVIVTLAAAGALALAALWMRERRARTVYPASQAAALLHPARRLLQSPERLVAAFGVEAGGVTVEVGPGPGYFTVEAARAAGPGGRVICLDLQRGMLETLRGRLPAGIASRVSPLAGDATRLPLADASVDGAFLVAVLGEVPEPRRAVDELRRVLRPGGVVSFAETLTDPDYVRQRVLRRMAEDAGLRFVGVQRQLLGYVMRFEKAG